MSYHKDRHAAYMKASMYEIAANRKSLKSDEKHYQTELRKFNKKYEKEALNRFNPRKGARSKFIIYGLYAPRTTKLLFFAMGSRRCIERTWYEMATKARGRVIQEGTTLEQSLLDYGEKFSIRKLEQSDSRSDIHIFYDNLRGQYPRVSHKDCLPDYTEGEYE